MIACASWYVSSTEDSIWLCIIAALWNRFTAPFLRVTRVTIENASLGFPLSILLAWIIVSGSMGLMQLSGER